MLESAVDYHRVLLNEDYEQVLMRFLVGRDPVEGAAMSFLQPGCCSALPLVALPIIIHLINQRRYQTIRWAAMMFLLAANRMSRGYARLRQWLIMAFRMLAIAGLVFAVSRPLASGWLGLAAGGRPDTTIILLDRSPSMQQTGRGGGDSKLETGVAATRRRRSQTLGSAHWVLIDSTTKKPRELESPDAPLTSPAAEATSAACRSAGACCEAACDYIQTNKSGRTEIWICSDLRQNDWNAESGRWQALRECVPRAAAGNPLPPAGLSRSGRRQRLGARDGRPPRSKTDDAADLVAFAAAGAGRRRSSREFRFPCISRSTGPAPR